MKNLFAGFLFLFVSACAFAETSTINTDGSGSGMNNWSACISAEAEAQGAAAAQCKGKVSDCDFTDHTRRLGDDNFTCSASCHATCSTEDNSNASN